MKRGQLVVLVLAVVAVGAAVLIASGGGGKGSGGSGSKPPAGATVVTFAASPEKLELVQHLADEFNRTHPRAGGQPVFIQPVSASSGDEEIAIAKAVRNQAGGDRPVVWSPASTLWGRLLNFDADTAVVADQAPSIVHTPLVIAMWEPEARALGWPQKHIGFADLLRLAKDKRGWAAYGHPEYGAFKLVHTNPSSSTSGLEAVAAEYYAATGKREGLTAADIDRPAARDQVRALERSIVHYGDTTLFISDNLRKEGPSYASAVAMEEATLVDFNNHRGNQPKLVALYPTEGSFFSDSPYFILKAPWVTAAQRAGAEAFARWLPAHADAATVARFGFRPASGSAPAAPIDAAHGADPKQPTRILAAPTPDVLARVRQAWLRDRKPANVELVLDTSGSMNDEDKLGQAKQGLRAFLRQLSPRDRVGLQTFSDDVHQIVPIEPYARDRGRLQAAIRDVFAGGQTALYDATEAGTRTVQQLHDPTRINAVVVLTDGEDTGSSQTDDGVVRALQAQARSEGLQVRVFTIAYGSGANRDVLTRIADASGGKEFDGDPAKIEAVYRSISSFF